jgi:hypothetical protein
VQILTRVKNAFAKSSFHVWVRDAVRERDFLFIMAKTTDSVRVSECGCALFCRKTMLKHGLIAESADGCVCIQVVLGKKPLCAE